MAVVDPIGLPSIEESIESDPIDLILESDPIDFVWGTRPGFHGVQSGLGLLRVALIMHV